MTFKSKLKSSVATPRAPEPSKPDKAAAPKTRTSKAHLKALAAIDRGREQSRPGPFNLPKTLSIPEAGHLYFGLSKNGAYDAAERGEIPYIEVGRLKRVPVALMEKMMTEPTANIVPPPPIETPIKAAKALAKPSKYPRSTAVRRRDRSLESVD
jgi:hypothetical protein